MTNEQHLENISANMVIMREDVGVIKRGMYGDKENNVKGLIQRQDDDEKRLGTLESKVTFVSDKVNTLSKESISKKTVAAWVAGISSRIAAIGHTIKEYLK
jgi:hypothetical protein